MFDLLRSNAASWLTKIIFGLIIIAFIFLGVGNFSGSSSTVLAEVNGENITIHEFWRLYSQEMQTQLQNNPELRNDKNHDKQLRIAILSQMIKERLQMQTAEEMGLFVTPHELLQAVSQFTVFQDKNGNFDANLYAEMLKSSGQSAAQFEANFKRAILIEKLIALAVSPVTLSEAEARSFFNFSFEQRKAEYVLFANKDFTGKTEIPEQEIQTYYDENKERFREPAKMSIKFVLVNPQELAATISVSEEELKEFYKTNISQFQEKAAFRVRHIFLSAPADERPTEKPEVMANRHAETIAKIKEELANGTPFAALAEKYSEESTTASKGGDMGWINQGELPIEIFERTALALEPQQVSEPFTSDFGTHIIMLEEKREAASAPFEKVRENIKNRLTVEQATTQEEQIRLFAADELGKGTPLNDIASALKLSVKSTGLVPVEQMILLLNLPETALTTLESIPLGETAPAPLQTKDGILLVQMEDSKPEHVPALEAIREQIVYVLESRVAKRMALEAAKEALPKFTGTELPAGFTGKATVSEPFSRVIPMVPQFGSNIDIISALTLAAGKEWLPQTFEVPDGVIIARVYSVIPVEDSFWQREKANVMPLLLQDKQNNAYNAFLQKIVNSSRITENMELLLNLQSQGS